MAGYEARLAGLETETEQQKEEISRLAGIVAGLTGFESEVRDMKQKMSSISEVYDDLQEKMHDVDKSM